jgi:hypothetical protein
MTTSTTYFSLTVTAQLFRPYRLMPVANVIPTNLCRATAPGVLGATLLLSNSCKECDNHRVLLRVLLLCYCLTSVVLGSHHARNSNSA